MFLLLECWNDLSRCYTENIFQFLVRMLLVFLVFNINRDYSQWCLWMSNCIEYFLAKTRINTVFSQRNPFSNCISLSCPYVAINVKLGWTGTSICVYNVPLATSGFWHADQSLLLMLTEAFLCNCLRLSQSSVPLSGIIKWK